MISLRGSALASSITDPDIRGLVEQRFAEILDGETYNYDQHGYMIVVEPGDSGEDIEKESSCQIVHDLWNETRFGDPDFAPAWEALEEHASCFEMVFVLSDDGFGINIFIPKTVGIDIELLSLCTRYAEPITEST